MASGDNRIREIRERRKSEEPDRYTQAALAFRLGIDASTLRRWETGAVAPSKRHAKMLAKALGVTVADLDLGTADG